MDDIWQRHKAFIVQCVVGGIIFLIALGVKSSSYDGIENTQRRANSLKKSIDGSKAPADKHIREQQANEEEAERQIRALAEMTSSVAQGDDYVKENIGWNLATLGLQGQEDRFFQLYKDLPQACLSQLKEEAVSVLVSRAARLGKDLDETMGVKSGFDDADVKVGIHGLAIVTDVVKRCLDLDGIEGVTELSIQARARRTAGTTVQDEPRANTFSVRVIVRGDPDAINTLIRSFNSRDNHLRRVTVVDSVDYIQRERKDDDTVKAAFNLFGLQYRGIGGGEK